MKTYRPNVSGFAWLELLLVLAFLALVFQLFPSVWTGTVWALDIRNWPRTFWFAANGVALLALVAVRFGPDLYQEWLKRQERLASERAKKQKQQELKEQRETFERLQRGRSRRIY